MSIRLFFLLAGGTLFPLQIYLLCVEQRWRETIITVFSVLLLIKASIGILRQHMKTPQPIGNNRWFFFEYEISAEQ